MLVDLKVSWELQAAVEPHLHEKVCFARVAHPCSRRDYTSHFGVACWNEFAAGLGTSMLAAFTAMRGYLHESNFSSSTARFGHDIEGRASVQSKALGPVRILPHPTARGTDEAIFPRLG